MLIIFDYDGVLRSINWEGIYSAYKAIFAYKRVDCRVFFTNLDEFKEWFEADFKKKLKETLNLTDADFVIANKIFREHHEKGSHIFPWVPNLAEELSKRHELAILSSSSAESVKESLGELQGFFSLIVGQNDVANMKPDPEGIDMILERTEWECHRAIIIGDANVDVDAGKRAGIKTGIVGWGLCEWRDLLVLDPDYKFKNPEDLFLL